MSTPDIEIAAKRRLKLFSGRSHPELAEEIADLLGVQLGQANLVDFASSEMGCTFGESIRGADVFLIQTHCEPVDKWVWEQLIMVDAAKRASAKRITAVIPFYGHSRQDRKSSGREPITAKLLADCLTVAGVDRVMTVDLHSGQIQGFFDRPVDHLRAMPLLVDYLRREVPDGDVVIVAPDAGRVKVAEWFSQHVDADLAIVHKRRPKGTVNVAEAMDIVGDVDGRRCVIIDDMIDTAGTMCAAADLLAAQGAEEVWAMAAHGVLSDPATDRLKNAPIERVVITNTLPLPPERQLDKIVVLSAAKILADAIDAVFEDSSVSDLFGGENQI